MRFIKRLFFVLVVIALILVGIPTILAALAIQQQPLVSDGQAPTAADAKRAQALAKRALGVAFSPDDEVSLTASSADVSSLLAFVARAVPGAQARASVNQYGMLGALTLPLPVPDNPVGRYLNFTATLGPSDNGINLTDISVGDYGMRGRYVLRLARRFGDYVVGNRIVSRAMNNVHTVSFEGQRVRVTFQPMDEISDELRAALNRLRGASVALDDPATVGAYYAKAAELHRTEGGSPRVALARYLAVLAKLASERSSKGDAVVENQAMIMGLALYFTKTEFFERLIGKVRTGGLADVAAATGAALLDGRNDLMQHFLVSAALQILADNGITYSIGEFKELLDSNRGGSGFSFVDLAADRTGVRFAEALSDPATAAAAQALLARATDEAAFAPRMTDLPENMTDAEFRSSYGAVDDERYKAVVREIDKRIAGCALYGT